MMNKAFCVCLICCLLMPLVSCVSGVTLESSNPIDWAFTKVSEERGDELKENLIFAYVHAWTWRNECKTLIEELKQNNITLPFAADIWHADKAALSYSRNNGWADSGGAVQTFGEMARFYKTLAYDCIERLEECGVNADIRSTEDEIYEFLNNVSYSSYVPGDFEAFGVMEVFSAMRDELNPLPVVAALPDEEIYLLYSEICAVLSIKDKHYVFPWNDCITPRGILPKLALSDYDGDGGDELAVILYVGSGTGLEYNELHLIKLDGDWAFYDNKITSQNIEGLVSHRITAFYNPAADEVEFSFDKQTVCIDVSDVPKEKYQDIYYLNYGNICRFSAEDSALSVHITIGLCGFDYPLSPFDFVEFYADLTCTENGYLGGLTLSNCYIE